MSSQPSRPTASLILRQTGQRYRLTQSPLTLGRHPSNNVVLADPQVSRHHARILYQAGRGWVLEDLGSANGTFVNDQRLVGARRLRSGDTIQIGPNMLDVRIAAPAPIYTDATQPTPNLAMPPADYGPLGYDEEEYERSGTSLLPIVLIGGLVIVALGIGLTLLLTRGLRANPAPTVAILAPAPDSQLTVNDTTTIQVTAQDNLGVTRIELHIDGEGVSTTTSVDARGDPTLSASQTWRFEQPGSHSISAVAYDARGASSAPAAVVVNVVAGAVLVTPTSQPVGTPVSPTDTPMPTDTPEVIIPTATPPDTPTPSPTATPPNTPTPTITPTPTATPSPSAIPKPTIEYFRVVPSTIPLGACALLEWGRVENASRADIEPGIGGVGTPGSTEVCPTATTTFYLTATGPGGVATMDVTVFVEAAALPDLTVGGVAYEPEPPVAQQDVVVTITLRNVGQAPAGPFRWEYQAGTYPPFGGQVSGLEIGASVIVTGTWQPESWYTSLATETRVDPEDDVPESNEGNNTFAESIQVLPPLPKP
jgi:hypothetical protein